jgi:hypothetical protein
MTQPESEGEEAGKVFGQITETLGASVLRGFLLGVYRANSEGDDGVFTYLPDLLSDDTQDYDEMAAIAMATDGEEVEFYYGERSYYLPYEQALLIINQIETRPPKDA